MVSELIEQFDTRGNIFKVYTLVIFLSDFKRYIFRFSVHKIRTVLTEKCFLLKFVNFLLFNKYRLGLLKTFVFN